MHYFIVHSYDMEEKGNGFRFSPHVYKNCEIANTITTHGGGRMDDNFIIYIENNRKKYVFDRTNNDSEKYYLQSKEYIKQKNEK